MKALPKQSQILSAAMRCQHRPLVLCKAFQREKVSVRASTVISASTSGDVTPRINCELPKLGVIGIQLLNPKKVGKFKGLVRVKADV